MGSSYLSCLVLNGRPIINIITQEERIKDLLLEVSNKVNSNHEGSLFIDRPLLDLIMVFIMHSSLGVCVHPYVKTLSSDPELKITSYALAKFGQEIGENRGIIREILLAEIVVVTLVTSPCLIY